MNRDWQLCKRYEVHKFQDGVLVPLFDHETGQPLRYHGESLARWVADNEPCVCTVVEVLWPVKLANYPN